MDNKFWTVETAGESYRHYDRYDSLKKAEENARAQAWKQGEDYAVMAVVAVAKAPEQVNSVKLEAVN